MREPRTRPLVAGAFTFLILWSGGNHCSGATSTVWEVTGFDSFLKGRLSGLLLTPDGILEPGPATKFKTDIGQPALWSVTRGSDGSVYAATGHSGKVFRISPDGKLSQFWTAQQAEVFALSTGADGKLYAGTSPHGGLYRLEGGTAEEIWHSPVKYIWALQTTPDGGFYVATGEQGQIFEVARNGKAKIFYETGQGNVTALALGRNGHLYAGTDPNGLLYEITGEKQGGMLFDSSLPEIRSIIPGPDGVIYAAAMGGAVSTRTGTGSAPVASSSPTVVAANPTVITVTEASRGGLTKNVAEGEQSGIKGSPDASKAQSSTSATTASGSPSVVEVAGVEKSAIYKINADKTVETLRSSKDDNVYDLLLDEDTLIFSTDNRGRMYRLNGSRATLLADEADGEMTRLLKVGSVFYGALSNPARLVGLSSDSTGHAQYDSQVHDSVSVARWGHLQWRGSGSGVQFRTRTGNSARPDATWSNWSPPMSSEADTLIQSPPARFIQWRAEWRPGSNAEISGVTVPYLPRNGRPQIRSVTVTSILGTNAAKSAAAGAGSSSAYSVTVTDTGDSSASSGSSASTQTVSRLQGTQTQVSWQADDPDGDKLSYSLYFRADDAKQWQLIRSRMNENTLLLDPDVFADGRYFFRVVAMDLPANAPDYAQSAELVSTPVLIDNTPPVVTLGAPQRSEGDADIDVDANDRTSPLRLCEYSLDAGAWQPIEAKDGVTDSAHENFHVHLEKLKPGEHLLVVRVFDTPGNAGLARVVLR